MTFDYDPNTGVITLKNPDSLKLRFPESFVDFLGVPSIIEFDATIFLFCFKASIHIFRR